MSRGRRRERLLERLATERGERVREMIKAQLLARNPRAM